MVVVIVLAVIVMVTFLTAWLAYLRFLSKVPPAHYKDVAVPVKAFRTTGIGQLAEAIMGILAMLTQKPDR